MKFPEQYRKRQSLAFSAASHSYLHLHLFLRSLICRCQIRSPCFNRARFSMSQNTSPVKIPPQGWNTRNTQVGIFENTRLRIFMQNMPVNSSHWHRANRSYTSHKAPRDFLSIVQCRKLAIFSDIDIIQPERCQNISQHTGHAHIIIKILLQKR